MIHAKTKAELVQMKASLEKYLKEDSKDEEILDILKILLPLSIKKELITESKIGNSIKKIKDKYSLIYSTNASKPFAAEIIQMSNELMLAWKKVIQEGKIRSDYILLMIFLYLKEY